MPYTVFAGGVVGAWRVESIEPVTGPSLPMVSRLAVFDEGGLGELDVAWTLRGLTSNVRYTRRNEQDALAAKQAELGRPEATRAALIPITKSQAWWGLARTSDASCSRRGPATSRSVWSSYRQSRADREVDIRLAR